MDTTLAGLRRTVRALESASRHGADAACLPTGADGFDASLGGGLALGAVSQIQPGCHRDEPAALSFALACAARAMAVRGGWMVWIADGAAGREWGLPHGPGLQAMGIALSRLLVVDAPDARTMRGCLEDAARTPGLACVLAVTGAEAGTKAGFDLVAARRVQLAAEEGGALVLLASSARAPVFAPARARLSVTARPSRVPDWAADGVPGLSLPPLGPPAFRVRVERARGGQAHHSFDLEYDHATHRLHQPAPLADRPALVQPDPAWRRAG
jgi:protein ImuA